MQEIDADQTDTNPAYLTNGDLYSNLATFSFGNPRSTSGHDDSSLSSYDADEEAIGQSISPLTPMNRKLSVDRTPRPSVSGHSPGKPTGLQQRQPPNQSTASGSTSRNVAVGYTNHYDDENEEPVDFDYRPRRGRKMSDTASQHTFGGGHRRGGPRSSSSSRSRSSVRSPVLEFSSEDEVELDYDSVHGTYTQVGLDADEEVVAGGRFMGPDDHGRRGSLPMAIPGMSADDVLRNREDSLATLRRPSRSLDDDLRLMNAAAAVSGKAHEGVVPKSEPSSRADWRNLEIQQQQQQQQQQQNVQPPQENALDGYDASYILEDTGSRRGSVALSYIDRNAYAGTRGQPSRQSFGFKAGGWGAGLAWSGGGRRPSTATTGTMYDDTFTANVRRFDPEFGGQKGEWSFKREKADGFGAPPQSSGGSIKGGHSKDPLTVASEKEREKRRRATMAPGTQELWRNEFVGRFKVDRLALTCEFLRPDPH